MVKDLTFDFSRSIDLHVHPFVPLGPTGAALAVAPQFPLHSRPDENILRVCSMVRPAVFDAASLEKETELLGSLKVSCASYSPQGPITLPKPTPDIDLLMSDEASSTLVIAELKWIRKPLRPIEVIDRNEEIIKGIKQLKQISDFIVENPAHLSMLGKLSIPVTKYENVYYLLIARDHWLWIKPCDGIAIVEFEAFSAALGKSENLRSAMKAILSYDWLPLEGRDFTVQYDRATVNGVSVESEVFYAR